MNKMIKKTGFTLLLTFLVVGLHAQDKKPVNALLWEVSGKALKEPSYLLGTYHLLNDSYLKELPETEKPLQQAKGIVVELVLDSAKMMGVMMRYGIMLDHKLSTLLTEEEFKLVDEELQRVSPYSLKTFDMLKPAQVSMMIMLMQAQKLNAELMAKYPGVAMDIHLASFGKKQGKIITPLETMEQQFELLLNHHTVQEQAKQLVEAIKQKETGTTVQRDMLALYMAKDLYGLQKLMEGIPESVSGNMDYMLKDRNLTWMKSLPTLMQTGSQFIAVGAGHLPGEFGLIELLRKEGYTVKAVTK
jgi:uncharacterized protein